MLDLYFIFFSRFEEYEFYKHSFKENEFNSTVLWLQITLLSISRSPLLCFCFQVVSGET